MKIAPPFGAYGSQSWIDTRLKAAEAQRAAAACNRTTSPLVELRGPCRTRPATTDKVPVTEADRQAIVHLRTLVGQASELAEDGASLLRSAQFVTDPALKERFQDHGERLLSAAEAILMDVCGGETRRALSKRGITAQTSKDMGYLYTVETKVSDLVAKLRQAPEAPVTRSAQEVLDSHATAYLSENLSALVADYAPNAVIYTAEQLGDGQLVRRTYRGRDEVRAKFEAELKLVKPASSGATVDNLVVSDRSIRIEWHAKGGDIQGSDTLIINERGQIVEHYGELWVDEA